MENDAMPYQVSSLICVYLQEEKGIDVGSAAIKYYQLLGKGTLGNEAFNKAFGWEDNSWPEDFDAWLENEVAKI